MTKVTLQSIKAIVSPERQKLEWGDRLLASFILKVNYDGEKFEFVWVMAGTESVSPCPEYDDDFDGFLVKVCDGNSFNASKKFINDIQEKFSFALHHFYTGSDSNEVELPIVIVR